MGRVGLAKLCGPAREVLLLDLREGVGDGLSEGENVARVLSGLSESFAMRKDPQTG